jgi:hypothetical protein
MVVVGFLDGKTGGGGGQQWRTVVRSQVGGRRLQFEPYDNGSNKNLWACHWFDADRRLERLVTRDVQTTAAAVDADAAARMTDKFPADGGGGMPAVARWAWYPLPGTQDELLFPKGAEIHEIDDVNGEWFHGIYMGTMGLFPAPYVRRFEGDVATPTAPK